MNRAVETLKTCKVFHLATVEGDQPRVRPLAAVAEINGKLYICSNNTKEFYKQMLANPKVEISAMIKDDQWIRICGTVEQDTSTESKEEFLRQYPLPGYSAHDGIFEVFYFTKGTATISSFTAAPESFEI